MSLSASLTVALVSDVFVQPDDEPRLLATLVEARSRGADLAVLPEIPLNRWSPATETAKEEDAEPPGGPRHDRLGRAARTAAIALVGGAIVRDPKSGRRHNTALVFDTAGMLVGSYRKVHLPEEPGF